MNEIININQLFFYSTFFSCNLVKLLFFFFFSKKAVNKNQKINSKCNCPKKKKKHQWSYLKYILIFWLKSKIKSRVFMNMKFWKNKIKIHSILKSAMTHMTLPKKFNYYYQSHMKIDWRYSCTGQLFFQKFIINSSTLICQEYISKYTRQEACDLSNLNYNVWFHWWIAFFLMLLKSEIVIPNPN